MTGGTDGLDRIKSEIQFFMSKCFQASFGYLAAVAAIVAFASSKRAVPIANATDVRVRVLVAGTILTLNLFYFTMILACTYAIVKRGYFIIREAGRHVDREWERFARVAPVPRPAVPLFPVLANIDRSRSMQRVRWLLWNIDNFYMVPIFFVIAAMTGTTAYVGMHASRGLSHWILIFLAVLHIVPSVIAASLFGLSRDIKAEVAIHRI
jgi:hypothetical protein